MSIPYVVISGADDEADFTGITELRRLFVSDAFHSASIAVDENGTEAAAATAIVMEEDSSAESTTFTVDRPFVFGSNTHQPALRSS